VSAPPVKFDSLEKGLFVLDRTRMVGHMTGTILASYAGWNRAAASRYLTFLATWGWLERVNDGGHPRYVLGPKALALTPDFSL
jgi:DNA-binding IclR family transcriptional regulator